MLISSLKPHILDVPFSVKLLIIVMLAILLNACSDGGMEVSSTFSNTKDIKPGALVYFNEQVVGEVIDVAPVGSGSRVAITLNAQVLNDLSSSSALVVNRLKEGAPLEIYNRDTQNSEPLSAGQELRGLDSMVQLSAWMVGNAIQLGAGSVSAYVQAFQEYLKSDQFQQEKDNFQIEVNGAAITAADAIQAVEQDLNKAMDQLLASEDEVVAAVEELANELSPVVEELSKSSAKLADELERFAVGLEATSETGQQSGQKLLDSLIVMLEKLNDSIEQGAAKPKVEQALPSD
ncbi:MAG: ABC-type transporter Mla subunit MlaD [Cryomorphaceae bacterium]|jgi:ABC-type transporter Mla subunit MlaD